MDIHKRVIYFMNLLKKIFQPLFRDHIPINIFKPYYHIFDFENIQLR